MKNLNMTLEKMFLSLEREVENLIAAYAVGEITDNEFDEVGDTIRWLEEHLRTKMEYEMAARSKPENIICQAL